MKIKKAVTKAITLGAIILMTSCAEMTTPDLVFNWEVGNEKIEFRKEKQTGPLTLTVTKQDGQQIVYKDSFGDDLVIEQVYFKGEGSIKEYTLKQAQQDFEGYIKNKFGKDYLNTRRKKIPHYDNPFMYLL